MTVDPGGPDEREVDALADAEPVKAGEVIRIRTTGGGGWGDPLRRDPALVVRDVVWRKVSPEAALTAYGVVLTGSTDDSLGFDAAATERSGRAGRLPRMRSSTGARLRPAGRGCGVRGRRPGRVTMRPSLAEALDLEPHPEGGWYRQTWAAQQPVTLPDGRRGPPRP